MTARPGCGPHLAYLLTEAERERQPGLAEALAGEGVSVEQWRILRALSDGHGHSMSDLAEAVLMPHPTLTKAVDRLVDDALVYRRQDVTDRRRVAVYLSDLGPRPGRPARPAGRRAPPDGGGGRTAPQRTERLMRELARLVDSLD